MDARGLLLVFVCIAIAFYMEMEFLAILLILFLFFVVLGSLSTGKKKLAAAKKEEEILYPIIYEDVGPAPYLYSPRTELEVAPDWVPHSQSSAGVFGIGALFVSISRLIRGRK